MIEFGPTKQGTLLGKFTDRFGAECSIQESSYPEEDCIWLGVETDTMGESLPNGRMHLTRDHARALILALRHFAETGTLGVYDETDYHIGRWVLGVGEENDGILGRVMEVQPDGVLVQDNQKGGKSGLWRCSWERIGDVWVPTDAPPQGRSLFDHLED